MESEEASRLQGDRVSMFTGVLVVGKGEHKLTLTSLHQGLKYYFSHA
jgi:hypothetical protein